MKQHKSILSLLWKEHGLTICLTAINLFTLVWALLDSRPEAEQTLRAVVGGIGSVCGLVALFLAWLRIRHDYLAEVRRHTARMAEIDQEEQAELKKYADRHRIAQTMDAQQLAALARRNRKED